MKNLITVLAVILFSSLFANSNYAQCTETKVDSTYNFGVIRLHGNSKLDSINNWVYVAVVKNGLVGKIYFNGQLVLGSTWENVNYSLGALGIGRNEFYNSQYFKGWIDELRVSNIERSSTEINNHFNGNTELSADANTLALWHFNESGGSTFSNSKGGYGTFYNGVTFSTGKYGNAAYFDGINDYGNCNFNPPETTYTYEFWMKFDGFENRQQCPLSPVTIYATEFIFSPVIDTITISNTTFSTIDTTIAYGQNIVVGNSTYNTSGVFTDTLQNQVGCDSIITTNLYINTNCNSVNNNGLVAYFPFNGSANDESTTNNDAIVYGATLTTDRFGNPNSAYSFDGINDFIRIPHSNSYNSNDFSISLWHEYKGVGSPGKSHWALLSKNNTSSGNRDAFYLFRTPTIVSSRIGQGTTVHYYTYSDTLLINNWYHTLINYNSINNKYIMYVNGIPIDSAIVANPYKNTDPINIGTWVGYSNYINANIDDIRIYNRNLSYTEIQNLYQEGLPQDSGTDVLTSCDSLTWIDGITYYSNNNTAIYTLQNINGCDSVVSLDLTINQSNTGTDVLTSCDSLTWIDGITYYSSNNIATYTLTNVNGCDSVVSLDLTINYSNTGTDILTSCDSLTWIDGITYYTSNNTATYTLTNVNGCDSVVSLDLTINQSNTGTDILTSCDSLTWIDGITYYNSNNTATYTLTNVNGCDSVVSLDLTINYSNTGIDVLTSCDSLTWIDGITYYTSNNTATYTLTNVNGCDSVVSLDLTINYSNTGTDVLTSCDSLTWIDGITYYSSNNIATYTLQNINGCDSVVSLDLTINYSNTGTDVLTSCDSLTWIDGITYYTSNNTATYTLTNVNGCDSVVSLDLTINYSNTGTDVLTSCDSLTWIDGITYYTSNNTATHTLTNVNGCDSVVTLDLTINYSNTGTDVLTSCDSLTWIDGITYYSSNNIATYTLQNINGCDSVVSLDLTINYSNTGTDVLTSCDSLTWIDGITYYSSNNIATYTLQNINGCDSVVSLDLTINYSNTGIDVLTSCDSLTWIDGITYYNSNNTATYTLTNVNGCDSVVSLDLTIDTVNTMVTKSGIILTAQASNASFKWLDCDNNFTEILNEINQIYTPITNGNYAVEVKQNNCIDTSACIEINSVGITKNSLSNLKATIFPNPTTGNIMIKLPSKGSFHVYIFNSTGQKISEHKYNNTSQISINIDEPSGIYYLKIMSIFGTYEMVKIVKIK